MSKDNESNPPLQDQTPRPLTEERGLQPTKNPPPMPKVKPVKQEKGSNQ